MQQNNFQTELIIFLFWDIKQIINLLNFKNKIVLLKKLQFYEFQIQFLRKGLYLNFSLLR